MTWWKLIVLLAAAAMVVICVVNLARTLTAAVRRSRRGTRTSGMVVDVAFAIEPVGDGGMTTRTPTVEFTDAQGVRHQFRSHGSVSGCPLPGGMVPVWYDPDDADARPEVVPSGVKGEIAVLTAGGLVGVALLVFTTLFPW